MRYNSIGEYFYRLSNRCLAFALFPVIIVWILYLVNLNFFSGVPLVHLESKTIWLVVSVTGIIIMLVFSAVYLTIKIRLKRIMSEPSLGGRMKLYINIVWTRFGSFSFMLLLIGAGIFLTANLAFLYLLPIPVISFLFYWPSQPRMSKDLKLKPEESEVLKNKNLGV